MANTGGIIFQASANADVYVTLTNSVGTAATVFSDVAATVSLTTPFLIPQGGTQAVYWATGGTYTISAQYGNKNGPQIADPRTGLTKQVDIQVGEVGREDYTFVGALYPVVGVYSGVPYETQFGLIAASYPPEASNGTNVFTSGVLQMIKVYTRGAGTLSNIEYNAGVVGATLTAAQNLVGLYSRPVAGVHTLIGTCPDQSTNFTVLGNHAAALTVVANQSLAYTNNQQFYIGALSVGTTPVSFMKAGQLATMANYNVSVAAATARYYTTGSSLTALPATVTQSAGTVSVAQWAGLS